MILRIQKDFWFHNLLLFILIVYFKVYDLVFKIQDYNLRYLVFIYIIIISHVGVGGFNYHNLLFDETIIDFFHTMLVSLIWICAHRSMKKVRKHPKWPMVLGQRVTESLNIKSCENGQFRYHYIWWIPSIPIITIQQKNRIPR